MRLEGLLTPGGPGGQPTARVRPAAGPAEKGLLYRTARPGGRNQAGETSPPTDWTSPRVDGRDEE